MSAGDFFILVSRNEAQTCRIAASLALLCASGDCILLRGDLGAGKTAFARGFIQALSPDALDIVSPTFTLLQTYPADTATLYHFDLYRLEAAEEVQEIGLEEALQSGITLIEWPDIALGLLPAEALSITITPGDEAESRHLSFGGLPLVWEHRLKELTYE